MSTPSAVLISKNFISSIFLTVRRDGTDTLFFEPVRQGVFSFLLKDWSAFLAAERWAGRLEVARGILMW